MKATRVDPACPDAETDGTLPCERCGDYTEHWIQRWGGETYSICFLCDTEELIVAPEVES